MNKKTRGLKASLLLIAALLTARYFGWSGDDWLPSDASDSAHASPIATETDGAKSIADAFKTKRSGFMTEVGGEVTRVLADDDEGSRHQRFLVSLSNRHSVLVAHNIDLAPRVPLEEGDRVRLFGQYEWNEKGGVLHWTHHDPGGRHEGGWIELDGKRYE